MDRIKYIFTVSLLILGNLLSAQNIEFIENKGQWDKKVLFLGQVSAGAFYIHPDGFSVLQHKSDEWELLQKSLHDKSVNGRPLTPDITLTVHSHMYTVKFKNSNPQARVIADKPVKSYNNYFIGNDPSKWAANCKIYLGVTIKDIYPNIDVRYYSEGNTLKYDFIVYPGGNVIAIAMQYEGALALEYRG